MPKENAPGRKKVPATSQTSKNGQQQAGQLEGLKSVPQTNSTQAGVTSQSTKAAPSKAAAQTSTPSVKKSKEGNKPRIGGTAVPGAKSTQPKEVPSTNDPNQQQIASYNRDMRRRMQNLGTGPYNESQKKGKSPQERRKEMLERRKEKIEERRAELRKTVPGRISIGNKNTFFIIGVTAFLILLIMIFVILRLVLHVF